MTSVNMKAGEGLLYDHALWHSSPINQSDQLRLAIVMGVIPQGVPMKYYYQNGDHIEEYDANPVFFFEQNPENGPKGLNLCKSFAHTQEMLSEAAFNTIYLETHSPSKTKRRFSISSWFGKKK